MKVGYLRVKILRCREECAPGVEACVVDVEARNIMLYFVGF